MEGELKKKKAREQTAEQQTDNYREVENKRQREREQCTPHWVKHAELKLKDDTKNSGAEGCGKRINVTVLWVELSGDRALRVSWLNCVHGLCVCSFISALYIKRGML